MTPEKRSEMERAAVEYAERRFKELRGISVDEFTWKDSQFGRELLMMFQAYIAGANQSCVRLYGGSEVIDQKSLEQAAKESAEKCQIKYGRDFTQAVDMFKRGAEWQAKHCVTDCVKEADTKAPEEWAKEVQDACARTTKSFFSKQLPPAQEESYPNYVWVGFCRDSEEPKQVHPVKPHGDFIGYDWQMYFPASFFEPKNKRIAELEAQLAEANANLEWEKQQASRLHNERVEWHQKYVDENTKHAHDQAAMRDALAALELFAPFGYHEPKHYSQRDKALAKLKERLEKNSQ